MKFYAGILSAVAVLIVATSACWDGASLSVAGAGAGLTPEPDGGTTPPPPSPCAPGQTQCGAECKDTANDPLNCGACGNDCFAAPPPAPTCVGNVATAFGPPICAASACKFQTQTIDCGAMQRTCAGGFCGDCAPGLQDNDVNGSCTPNCPTSGLTCSGRGTCSDATGTAACTCKAPFTGKNCEIGPPGPIVFVSSAATKGNIGGLAGADAMCQGLAAGAGLSGTFKAFLSDSVMTATARLARPAGSYKLVTGTVVAATANDLFSGTLVALVDRDEAGVVVAGTELWTGSNATGGSTGSNCGDWTQATAASLGTEGVNGFTDGRWLNSYDQFCDRDARLYCVQQ